MTVRFASGIAALILLTACAPTPPAPPSTLTPEPGAVEAYRAWVLEQGDAFLEKAGEFTAAVEAGDRERAQALYAPSRMFFERIEPIAEALGDFDPRIDAREGDVPAEDWRGYHKLEKLLWSDGAVKDGAATAQTLLADIRLLRAKLETAEITVPALVAGAVELLNEVSSSKVTGEEERYSRTDLWDFQANVEGAEQIWKVLAGPVRTAEPELAQVLDTRFTQLYALLGAQRTGELFQPYNALGAAEVQALAAAVDALAEPLAQLGRLYPSE